MPTKPTLGGFDSAPVTGSFAARVARSDNPDATVDVSELTEAERTQLNKASAIDKAAANFTFVSPEQALERCEIVFDNSSSMSGRSIEDAKDGVTEFMKACTPNETAVRITPLNTASYDSEEGALKFTCNLPLIAERLKKFHAHGGTPLYSKLKAAITRTSGDLTPSRVIAFSDGEAGDGFARQKEWQSEETKDSPSHLELIGLAHTAKIVIDTCLIYDGSNPENAREYKTMKAIADDTGGVFILFQKGKCDFRRGFKYLTRGNRLLLMDSNFKAKLEAGQI